MHLIILILGLVLLPNTSALRCFQCNPLINQLDCTNTEVCGTNRDRCFNLKVNNVHTKGCATEALCNLAPASVGLCCSSDLCNGATIFAVSLWVLAAPLVCVALFN